ncbi:hypothetical protein JVU11DRAFT_9464 [Chiua virens]|nr:hypothetical protein JVU11DRAFT_9464 [Chiua virens]
MDIQGNANDDPQYILVGECAFSEQKDHALDKLHKYVRALPNLVVVILVVIKEHVTYRSLNRNSDAWSYFSNVHDTLSQKDFLTLHKNCRQCLCLGTPIIVARHTWCHVHSVDYTVWVRDLTEDPINLDITSPHSTWCMCPLILFEDKLTNQSTQFLYPEIRMEAMEAMIQKGIFSIKCTIVDYFSELRMPLDDDMITNITQSEIHLPINWTIFQGAFLTSMKVTAHHCYCWWLENVVFHSQKHPYDSDDEEEEQPSSSTQLSEAHQPDGTIADASHSQGAVLHSPQVDTQDGLKEATGSVRRLTKKQVIDTGNQ